MGSPNIFPVRTPRRQTPPPSSSSLPSFPDLCYNDRCSARRTRLRSQVEKMLLSPSSLPLRPPSSVGLHRPEIGELTSGNELSVLYRNEGPHFVLICVTSQCNCSAVLWEDTCDLISVEVSRLICAHVGDIKWAEVKIDI